MQGELHSGVAVYTIDSDALMEIFSDNSPFSKTVMTGLWDRILEQIAKERIISHKEVHLEIKTDGIRGLELFDWAQANKHVFKDHDWDDESAVIKLMSPRYSAFVDGDKSSAEHADPWLVAQAKCRGLTVITQENRSNSPHIERYKIPNICADPLFGVDCLDLLGLIKKEGWRFK